MYQRIAKLPHAFDLLGCSEVWSLGGKAVVVSRSRLRPLCLSFPVSILFMVEDEIKKGRTKRQSASFLFSKHP